jgi:hypothetical protein
LFFFPSRTFFYERMGFQAPPLEYMSMLHSNQQEISGRQVWSGSFVLANVLLFYQQQQKQQKQTIEHENDDDCSFHFTNQR